MSLKSSGHAVQGRKIVLQGPTEVSLLCSEGFCCSPSSKGGCFCSLDHPHGDFLSISQASSRCKLPLLPTQPWPPVAKTRTFSGSRMKFQGCSGPMASPTPWSLHLTTPGQASQAPLPCEASFPLSKAVSVFTSRFVRVILDDHSTPLVHGDECFYA